jgi:hypothetical protein
MTEELLEWKSSRSGSRKPTLTAVRDPLRRPHDTFYLQKLALTSPTSGDRSVGIVVNIPHYVASNGRMIGEMEGMEKEAVMTYLETAYRHLTLENL